MPLSHPVEPKTDSLFYATHNNHRILCVNDLNFMPENHALFSSPLPRANDFYPAACTSLSNEINVPPNGYVWSNCSCYLGTHVWKRFYSLIRDCGCSDPPPPPPNFRRAFPYLLTISYSQRSRTVGCEGEMGNINVHSAGTALPWNASRMRRRSQISAIIVITALSRFWRISAFLKMIQMSATYPPHQMLEQTQRPAPGMLNIFLHQWRAEERQLLFCYTLMHKWW